MADKILDKIAAILNKAENTDNEHERQSFMEAAQKMSARHAIDLEVARQHTTKKNAKQAPVVKNITLGEKGERLLRSRADLFMKIANENGVRVYVHGSGRTVDAFGMPSDIEMAELFYAVIVVQMVEEGNEFIYSGEYRKQDPNVNATVARSEFYSAFASRIGSRLRQIRWQQEREAAQEYGGGSMELVLASKRDEVNAGYRERYGKAGLWRPGGSTGSSPRARRAGDRAGERARLGGERQVTQGRGLRG